MKNETYENYWAASYESRGRRQYFKNEVIEFKVSALNKSKFICKMLYNLKIDIQQSFIPFHIYL